MVFAVGAKRQRPKHPAASIPAHTSKLRIKDSSFPSPEPFSNASKTTEHHMLSFISHLPTFIAILFKISEYINKMKMILLHYLFKAWTLRHPHLYFLSSRIFWTLLFTEFRVTKGQPFIFLVISCDYFHGLTSFKGVLNKLLKSARTILLILEEKESFVLLFLLFSHYEDFWVLGSVLCAWDSCHVPELPYWYVFSTMHLFVSMLVKYFFTQSLAMPVGFSGNSTV